MIIYGFAIFRNLTKLPCNAVGSVKNTLNPNLTAISKSINCAATWLNGKILNILPFP
jgi:hypothetical protein